MYRSMIYNLAKLQEKNLRVTRLARGMATRMNNIYRPVRKDEGSREGSGGGHELPMWLENNLKVKIEQRSPNETHIECVKTKEDPKVEHLKPCILCRLNITNLNYTDVRVLSQFIKKNGDLLTYHESGLCAKQYSRILKMIKQAQRCNLIPRPADYFVPGPWHDFNTYIERDRVRDQPVRQFVKKEYWKI